MTAPTAEDWAILARFGITPENYKTLTRVDVWNCPGLTTLPDLPAAARVYAWNCRDIIRIGDLPAATQVYMENCPGLTALPDLPAATHVDVYNCPSLIRIGDLPAAARVYVRNCPGLIRIGDLPVATSVDVWNCPGLTALHHDPRGYALIRIGDRYFAGCRNFTPAEAIAHWGAPDYPDPQRGAAYVKAVKAEEARRKGGQT
jgi:uncharacterized Zn-binding protein involved in type VI secretion